MGQELVGGSGEPLLNHVNRTGLYRHGGGTAFQRHFDLFLLHNHKPTNATENRGQKKIKRQVSP